MPNARDNVNVDDIKGGNILSNLLIWDLLKRFYYSNMRQLLGNEENIFPAFFCRRFNSQVNSKICLIRYRVLNKF